MRLDRAARRCALQAMYQFDADREVDEEIVRSTLPGSGAHDDAQVAGFALASEAKAAVEAIDPIIDGLSPDWPVRRQPMVDRNILRLSLHEISSGSTPPKVVINEAVELAREFGGEKSPGFINAILDEYLKTRTSEEPGRPGVSDGGGE